MTALARAELEAFRAVLAREAGLRFEDDKLPLLAELLRARTLETDCPSAGSYLDRVASRAEEIAELARALTVSETYFLRNRDQFHALEAILRERQTSPSRHLRLLSAGCSSGEEPYSLAIIVRETLSDLAAWSMSVLGVDLNPDVLARARAASYRSWSLRETPEPIRQRYFRQDGAHHVLAESVVEMVRFEAQNLLHPSPGFWRSEAFDVVFCRNVLMYFTPAAACQIVANIARSLAPGGYLFLGHAESLRGLSHDFHLRQSHGTFYYQRRSALQAAATVPPSRPGPSVAPATDTSWFDAIGRASGRIEQLARGTAPDPVPLRAAEPFETPTPRSAAPEELSPAMDLMKQERFQEALRLLASTSPSDTVQPELLLLRAMLLVSTGELAGAIRVCAELLAIDELNAGAHYITAMCLEHAGDRTGAVEHSHAAAYLDAGFSMPHLQLGRLARRAGDLATARRELGLAIGLLAGEDAARIILFGGGFGREALIALCRGELDACGVEP